jgi:hypothetical protein
MNFDFTSYRFPISPNQLNVCFFVVWNMYSRYMYDWDDIVKELLVVFSAWPEQGICFIISPTHQAFQKPPPA